jgi:hypothetical protein
MRIDRPEHDRDREEAADPCPQSQKEREPGHDFERDADRCDHPGERDSGGLHEGAHGRLGDHHVREPEAEEWHAGDDACKQQAPMWTRCADSV